MHPATRPWPQVSALTRTLLTRAVAIVPALLVALSADGSGDSTRMDALNQWLNVLQAVQLPFAVIPVGPPMRL